MGFAKVIGQITGGVLGTVTGTVVGGITAVINGVQTGDWKEAEETWSETINSYGEDGAKIGGECEKLVESVLVGAATAAGGYAAKKIFDDNKDTHKQA